MASIMASLPDSMKADMKSFLWVNWSEVAREAFIKKIRRLEALEKFEKILEKSQFTEEDALELSRKVKDERSKQHKKQSKVKIYSTSELMKELSFS